MAQVDIGVPEPILESLSEEDGTAAADMRRAVTGLELRGISEHLAIEYLERLNDLVERFAQKAMCAGG